MKKPQKHPPLRANISVSENGLDKRWVPCGHIIKPDRGGLKAEDVEFRETVHEWREARPQPIFSVRGNHDWHDKAESFQSSIDLTDGIVRTLGNDLSIAGFPALKKAIALIRKGCDYDWLTAGQFDDEAVHPLAF